jgi:hypothetical protein
VLPPSLCPQIYVFDSYNFNARRVESSAHRYIESLYMPRIKVCNLHKFQSTPSKQVREKGGNLRQNIKKTGVLVTRFAAIWGEGQIGLVGKIFFSTNRLGYPRQENTIYT